MRRKLFTVALVVALAAPPRILWGADAGRIQFENRQKDSGISFVLDNGTVPDKPMIDGIPGGVALLDYDNDGYLDIFFTNGASLPGLAKEGDKFSNRLYHNNHDGTFTDVTDRAGLRGEGYSVGAAAADYDNDGRTDLYVTGFDRNFLYRNNGDGHSPMYPPKRAFPAFPPRGKNCGASRPRGWIMTTTANSTCLWPTI